MMECPLCDGECQDANLQPLLSHDLTWLWEQVAAIADRRGDPAIADGPITIQAPHAPEPRAAGLRLMPGRPLAAGQSRPAVLAELSSTVRRRAANLSPPTRPAKHVR